jgi:hypothetical protein
MISHELRIVMNVFTALQGGRANTLHRSAVLDSGVWRFPRAEFVGLWLLSLVGCLDA